jgi:hypothetical protein
MQQFHKFVTWLYASLNMFRALHAHHQELTTALTASGFTFGALVVAALLVVVWPVSFKYYILKASGRSVCE